jgi:hypothetical protein
MQVYSLHTTNKTIFSTKLQPAIDHAREKKFEAEFSKLEEQRPPQPYLAVKPKSLEWTVIVRFQPRK